MGPHSRGPHSRNPPLKGAQTQRVEALFVWGIPCWSLLLHGALHLCGPPFSGGPGQLPFSPMPKSSPDRAIYKKKQRKKMFSLIFYLFFSPLLRTSVTAKSMGGLFFDQRLDIGAIN
jgi:hypothetical protein